VKRDPLTDLQVPVVRADAGPAAAIWIDIDHVKDFGGREGHAAGDEQIRLTAAVIRDVAGDGRAPSGHRQDGRPERRLCGALVRLEVERAPTGTPRRRARRARCARPEVRGGR